MSANRDRVFFQLAFVVRQPNVGVIAVLHNIVCIEPDTLIGFLTAQRDIHVLSDHHIILCIRHHIKRILGRGIVCILVISHGRIIRLADRTFCIHLRNGARPSLALVNAGMDGHFCALFQISNFQFTDFSLNLVCAGLQDCHKGIAAVRRIARRNRLHHAVCLCNNVRILQILLQILQFFLLFLQIVLLRRQIQLCFLNLQVITELLGFSRRLLVFFQLCNLLLIRCDFVLDRFYFQLRRIHGNLQRIFIVREQNLSLLHAVSLLYLNLVNRLIIVFFDFLCLARLNDTGKLTRRCVISQNIPHTLHIHSLVDCSTSAAAQQ